ncbi:unnamed protein product, partial [Amoebophrya sp. A25]
DVSKSKKKSISISMPSSSFLARKQGRGAAWPDEAELHPSTVVHHQKRADRNRLEPFFNGALVPQMLQISEYLTPEERSALRKAAQEVLVDEENNEEASATTSKRTSFLNKKNQELKQGEDQEWKMTREREAQLFNQDCQQILLGGVGSGTSFSMPGVQQPTTTPSPPNLVHSMSFLEQHLLGARNSSQDHPDAKSWGRQDYSAAVFATTDLSSQGAKVLIRQPHGNFSQMTFAEAAAISGQPVFYGDG